MQVNFFATFRSIVGKKTVYFDLAENITARQLLQAIIDWNPALKKHLVGEDEQLLSQVHLFINGHDVQLSPEGLDIHLQKEDKIDIFPPVAGG